MKIQLIGKFLDISETEEINYVMQVQDLADVSSVNSSFTTSFRLPKTLTNYEALEYLSLNSDTSKVPYTKQTCKLYNFDTTIIKDGWLRINNTDDYFNVSIENGIIDLFKAVEGKSIGKDLDLESVNHNKDVPTVINSFTRRDYCYIVADYNGMNTYRDGQFSYINTDYLVPSLNNKFIWDKVFSTFGFTYEGSVFDTDEFTNLWITYPKAPPIKEDDSEFPEPYLRASFSKGKNEVDYIDWVEQNGLVKIKIPSDIVLDGMTVLNDSIVSSSDGTFNVKSAIDAFATYAILDNWGYPVRNEDVDCSLQMTINGVLVRGFNNSYNFNLKEGDRLEFGVDINPSSDGYHEFRDFTFNSYDIKVYQLSQANIDFSKEFLDFPITDFLKENFIRFGLTPFIDVEKKHIKFLTLKERLNSSKVVDWSDKFIGRTNEMYTYSSYAQVNLYKHKYNDENATFNDGAIFVNNKNLEDSKDLYTSKIYSYNSEITRFYEGGKIIGNVFPIWSREVKEVINNEDNSRTIEVQYKGLSNRYYFMRQKGHSQRFSFGSQLLKVTAVTTGIPISDTTDVAYGEIIPKKYNELSKILSDTRIHNIDLDLDINDLLSVNFDEIYYFEQENQYYILNRLNFNVNNKKSEGEFLRIKYL